MATHPSLLARVLVAALATLGAGAAVADEPAPPYVYAHHEVSTSIASAQAAFDRGLTLIYAYQEEEAERAFREAAKLDPSLAMAWWGIALALGPDINNAPESAATVKAAKAIARARLLASKGASAAERDYIEALAARYSDADAPDFDVLARNYRDRMRELSARYPHDPDAAALLAEAIMDLHPWRLWNSDGGPVKGTSELVVVLETGLREHPEHVGLMHYYIHAVEASNNPGRALEAAKRLAATHFEPAAAHLVHMPAHTFLRVGDWPAAVASNEHAVHHALDFKVSLDPGAEHACGHCLDFLTYAYSMEGNFAQALAAATQAEAIEGEPSARIGVLARFRRYADLLALAEPPVAKHDYGSDAHVVRALWHYGRGLAQLGQGDVAAAVHELELERAEAALAPPDPYFPEDRPDLAHVHEHIEAAIGAATLSIADALLAGRIALARGKTNEAIARFRVAVEVQDRSQYSEPPGWYYPVRETLAAALESRGSFNDAAAVLKECLRRSPHDARATLAMRRVLVAGGRAHEAAALDLEIAADQARADGPLEAETF